MSAITAKSSRVRAHQGNIRNRVRLTFILMLIGFVLLACRLWDLQVVRHSHFITRAYNFRLHRIALTAERGDILDRNGIPLAMNVVVGDVVADPTEIADPDLVAKTLASLTPAADAGKIEARIISAKGRATSYGMPLRYVLLVKGVPYDTVEEIKQEIASEKQRYRDKQARSAALTGIDIHERWIRSYPKKTLAAQIVGFVITDPNDSTKFHGAYGIEKAYDAQLAGHDGYVLAEVDAQGRIIPGTERKRVEPVSGQNVTLTIDTNIQQYAEESLRRSFTEHHAETASCTVIDPHTGEILAIANEPSFDPNNLTSPVKTTFTNWDNHAVSDLYEPGSTLKTLTLSALLDERGLQMQNDPVNCTGTFRVGNHTIHCADDPPLYGVHGHEVMRDVLKNSCNIGAAHYALELGPEALYQYESAYGLLEKPGSGLPDELCSHLSSPDVKPWALIHTANIGFGQGISITALQLASVYATIANRGLRVYPRILMNAPAHSHPTRVVKPEVADLMLSMLQTVVEDGTGKPAQIEGYNIGGKTGSAQMAEHGHYGDQYIGSFCGIVPLTNPRYVILTVITKPEGVHWGAVVAAPVVHDVAERSLEYSRVLRDAPAMVDYADQKHNDAHPAHKHHTA